MQSSYTKKFEDFRARRERGEDLTPYERAFSFDPTVGVAKIAEFCALTIDDVLNLHARESRLAHWYGENPADICKYLLCNTCHENPPGYDERSRQTKKYQDQILRDVNELVTIAGWLDKSARLHIDDQAGRHPSNTCQVISDLALRIADNLIARDADLLKNK